MLRFPDSPGLVLSATDLTNFLACRRLAHEQLKSAWGFGASFRETTARTVTLSVSAAIVTSVSSFNA